MVTSLLPPPVEEARRELYAAAAAHDSSRPIDHVLEAAARAFAKAQLELAAGITAAKHQAERDEKRGRQLCSSCVTDVVPAKDRDGRTTWLDAKTMQPHRCGGRR